ncbi:MAG: hypothetical protein ACRYFS_24165 [Janthinobacterium lividum]
MSQAAAENQVHFVLCILKGKDDDLELRKAYAVLPPAANETGYLRVIDESGEDYLYPADCFVPLELPQSIERVLLAA